MKSPTHEVGRQTSRDLRYYQDKIMKTILCNKMEAEKYSREPLTAFRKQFFKFLDLLNTWYRHMGRAKSNRDGYLTTEAASVTVFNTILRSFIYILIIPSSSEDARLVFSEYNA